MKPLRLLVLVVSAFFLAGAAYAALFLSGGARSRGEGSAYATANCQITGSGPYTATISLVATDTSTTLGEDSSGNLLVDGAICTAPAGVSLTSASPNNISDINFTASFTGKSTQTVVLDQTQPGGVFPCTTAISGNLAGETLQIDAGAGEHVIVGDSGVNLGDGSGNSCTTGQVGSLTTIANPILVGGTGSGIVLDARGSTGTGSAVSAHFVAGDSSETFDAGAAGSVLDFSQLTCPSSPTNPCTVTANSTGSTVNGVVKFNAALLYGPSPQSSYTYTFSTNEADLTEVDGNSTIPTSWYAPASSTTYTLDSNVTLQGSAGSYTVSSTGSGNQINAGAGTESFNVNVIVPGSGVVMTGANGTGSSTDTFAATGSGNTFIAGTLADSFYDNGTKNIVSFAGLNTSAAAPLTIDADSSTTADPNAGTATVNGVTYTFLNSKGGTSDTNFSSFTGAATGNTTFQADSAGGLTFQGSQTTNTADFTNATIGITANLSGSQVTTSNKTPVPSGQVLVSCASCTPAPSQAAIDTLSNVGTIKGSSSGGNTFWGGSGTTSFVATSSDNMVNGADGGSYQVDMSGANSSNTIKAGSGTESFTVAGSNITMWGGTGTGAGSSTFTDATGTDNTFKAGSLPDYFYDGGASNTVDFSEVGTSPQDQLAVNLAGSPEAVTLTTTGGASPVTIQNGQAEVGTGTVYTFLNSATATGTAASSDFTAVNGPTSGNTQFLGGSEFRTQPAAGPGNLTFVGGAGGNNSLAFPTVNVGVVVNLQNNGSILGGTAYASGFQSTPDSLTDISTVTGSPSGSNSFTAGGTFTLGSSTTYNFIGNGNKNTFTGGAGPDIFTSNGNNNTFRAGSGNATFNDPTGTGNTVDFSQLTAATVTVNVTGGAVGSIGSTDEAVASQTSGNSQYFFSGFGANDATFIGASGNSSQTTFLAGSSGDTFQGGTNGAPADTLSFADAPGNSLQVCTAAVTGTCSAGQAILGKVAENFNPGIKIFDGLGSGNTTFTADDSLPGGYTFNGVASGNTADFSSASQPVRADLMTGEVSFTSGTLPDTISNVNTVYGSSKGGNTFTAAGSASETFGDRTAVFPATNGPDTLNFGNLQTVPLTPLTVNANGGGTSPYTATFGAQTYNFVTGGANFTVLKGALSGYTAFIAGSTPGYTFVGQPSSGAGDSIDFSADASSIMANLSSGTVQVDSTITHTDSIQNIPTVIGSPNGGNDFVAGTGPTETFKGGSNNIVDLSSLTTTAVVNASQAGQSPQSTGYGTATSGGTTYDFTAFESSPTTFVGAKGGTTFYAGPSSDSYVGKSATDTLSFADAPGTTLSLCQAASATANCSAGQAMLGNTTEYFQSIKTFDGLDSQGSTTTFYGDDVTGGKVFNGQAGANIADFTAAGLGLTADMTKGTVTFSSAASPDTISGVTTVYGSGAGGNTFFPSPSGSETFGDFGATPAAGDAVNFSHILGTTTTNPLTVNASLSTPASGVAPYTAQFGSLVYNFSVGGSNFTSFTGSASGNTTFLAAASSAGLTFDGTNVGNTGDFSLTGGIIANMATRQVALAGVTGYDTLKGTFSKVVGSPAGNNEFDGALTGTQFAAAGSPNLISYAGQTNPVTVNMLTDQVSGSGTTDSFSVPNTGTLTVEGSQASDTFQIGTRAVTLEGGGGQDSIDLSTIPPPASGSTGVTVDLNGSVTAAAGGPAIGGVTFTPGCSLAADLCVKAVTGTPESDTFIANQTLDPAYQTTITGGGGNDSLSLQRITSPVVVDLPITTGTRITNPGTCAGAPSLAATVGDVCAGPASSPGLFFSGMEYMTGSLPGGDDFFAGQSAPATQYITETGNPGTLDSSTVPSSANTSDTIAGIQIFASQSSGGSFSGSVNSSTAIGEQIDFTNIGTFIGTQDNDTFTQSGSGPVTNTGTSPPTGYVFDGRGGNNTVDLSAAPTGQLALGSPTGTDGCTTPPSGSGIPNPNDVTDTVSGVAEQFTCIGSVTSSSSEYQVSPGQTATVNGGGNGTIDLVSPPGDPQTYGCGVTVTMPVGTTPGSVQSNGCSDYNFSFTGASTIIGTPYNDLFVPGSASATLEGNGGSDEVSYAPAPAASVVNLSGSTYTIPAGYANSGTAVPPGTGIGGYGGTIKLVGISDAAASNYGDILVGGSGPGDLVGGSGNDTFVPTGGTDSINGGSGTNTVDLSLLPGHTAMDLGTWGWQNLGSGDGMVALAPGTIETAIGSPGGSSLEGGTGNGITLEGEGINDWLAAGVGNQTLVATGPGTTLVGGIGTDTLTGGSYPVTFVPGQGSDILSSKTTGNTLSYNGVTSPVQVNLSSQQQQFTWPTSATSPTVLPPQTASGGYGATVSLSNAGISTVVGSSAGDIFVTGSTPVTISGNGGDDLFAVTSGGNTLTAGNGTASRFLIDGPGTGGTNVIHGGGAAWIDYSLATSGANVNLQNGMASGGFSGATETLSGVLNIEGSNYNDVLVAGTGHATVIGLNGNDVLEVSPVGQDLLVSGGSGNDTFCDQAGCNGMSANPTAGSTLVGGTGDDTFYAQQTTFNANKVMTSPGVVDHIDGGAGYNTAYIDAADQATTSNVQNEVLPTP